MLRSRIPLVLLFIMIFGLAIWLGQFLSSRSAMAAQTASLSGEPDDGESADIPRFARGHLTDQEYLHLRDLQLGLKRGVNDLIGDPRARFRAVQVMQSRQRISQRQQAASQAVAGGQSVNAASGPAWSPLGPAPIQNGQVQGGTPMVPVSGRVTAIAVDPMDATGNTVYVGTAQGGLYRSLDGGATWTPLMDSAASLAIGAITIDPVDHAKLFVGTGEGNFSLDSFFGVGIFVITNATTAPVLTGPFHTEAVTNNDIFTGRAITRILVNPTNDNKILVSTSSGLSGASGDTFSTLPSRGVYLSQNALGAAPTFTKLTAIATNAGTPAGNRAVTDMAMDPGNPAVVVVNVFGTATAGDGGIWVSNADPWSGTATWTQTVTKQAIAKLAVNRSGTPPATTFFSTFDESVSCTPPTGAVVTVSGTLNKSVDGGMTWNPIPKATGFCGSQCSYDMATAVHPTMVNTILLGGQSDGTRAVGACGHTALAISTDGANFTTTDTSLHVDTHAIVFAPGNPNVVYEGNDGGIFRSTNGGSTWTSLNTTGFSATQFESLAVHPTDPNFTIGGTQDNGTEALKPDGTTWTRADFGDGGFSAIDQNAADTTNVTMYHTYFNLTNRLMGFAQVTSVANATDGSWNFLGCSLPTATATNATSNNGIGCMDSIFFYAPLALGPGNPNTVYFGTDRLYRSTNQGASMTVVSQGPFVATVPVTAIGISPQDDNVRLVGLANGQVFATTSGANPLTDVTGAIPAKFIARAVIDPNNKFTAYVTLDGYGTPNHVWKTTNLNAATPTWNPASSGLPDVPANAFAVDPENPNNLYAGTDIGVFNSTDGGNTWAAYGTGLPVVAVFDLKLTAGRKVRIATHGRGMWETAAVAVQDFSFQAPSGVSQTIVAGATATYNLTMSSNNGFAGAVSFACSGAPGGSTCMVNPNPLNLTGTSSNIPLTVSVSNTQNAGMAPAGFKGLPLGLAMVLAGLVVVAVRKPRRAFPAFAVLLVASVISCGGGSSTPPPPPKPNTNAVLTVTATSGSITRTITLNLTVTH